MNTNDKIGSDEHDKSGTIELNASRTARSVECSGDAGRSERKLSDELFPKAKQTKRGRRGKKCKFICE